MGESPKISQDRKIVMCFQNAWVKCIQIIHNVSIYRMAITEVHVFVKLYKLNYLKYFQKLYLYYSVFILFSVCRNKLCNKNY